MPLASGLYGEPSERARLKVLPRLDDHMRRFIAKSPFVIMATVGPTGADATPRGGDPGFVRVLDDTTVALPDWPGNNRLDSLGNVMSDSRTGLLFLVPGVDESLRVNGTAEVVTDPATLALWSDERRLPKSALRLTVNEAFLHCGKALIRSRLWDLASRIDRSELPPYGTMLKDQIDVRDTAEQIQTMVERGYTTELY